MRSKHESHLVASTHQCANDFEPEVDSISDLFDIIDLKDQLISNQDITLHDNGEQTPLSEVAMSNLLGAINTPKQSSSNASMLLLLLLFLFITLTTSGNLTIN